MTGKGRINEKVWQPKGFVRQSQYEQFSVEWRTVCSRLNPGSANAGCRKDPEESRSSREDRGRSLEESES